MHIFALGGGDLSIKETLPIDRRIVEAAGKPRPHALFVPTAGQDDPEYCVSFKNTYAGELGCEVDFLLLYGEDQDGARIAAKIEWADLIYVGGGNSRRMLALWRELGVDKLLRIAGASGTILSGLSAGANCWFRYCNSDWPLMEGRTDMNTARLECMGFVDLTFCPHMKREEYRIPEFKAMMMDTPGVGIGADDCAAFEIKGESYRVLACSEEYVVHRMWRDGDQVSHERLAARAEYRSIEEIKAVDQRV